MICHGYTSLECLQLAVGFGLAVAAVTLFSASRRRPPS